MFRKFMMALAATTMIASPMVVSQAQAAPHREVTKVVKKNQHGRNVFKQRTVVRKNDYRGNRYSNSRYNNDRYNNNHRWAKGQRFDRHYATNYRVIDNYRGYHLNAPPRGYRWVQSGNDAVLIAITSGLIGAVIGGVLN